MTQAPTKICRSKAEVAKFAEFYAKRIPKKQIEYGVASRDVEFVKGRKISDFLAAYYGGILDKGIMFMGVTGVGKSYPMKLLSEFMNIPYYTAVELANFNEVKRAEVAKSCKNFSDSPSMRDIIIDDLGKEEPINNYGVKYESMTNFLDVRHEQYLKYGALTFITTNLSLGSIAKRYGDRTESRLHQICTIIPLKGKDRRKQYFNFKGAENE